MFFLFACGPKAMVPRAKLDTPEHHVANGKKLLRAGKISAAFREFTRGKELDSRYSRTSERLFKTLLGLRTLVENGTPLRGKCVACPQVKVSSLFFKKK